MATIEFKNNLGKTVITLGPLTGDGKFAVKVSYVTGPAEVYVYTYWEFDQGQMTYFQKELRDLYEGRLEEVYFWNDCGKRIRFSGKNVYDVRFYDTFDLGTDDSCIQFHFNMDQTNIHELLDSLHGFMKEYSGIL